MPANIALATLSRDPITFARVITNQAAHLWVFPTNPAQTLLRFPASNTRQIIILNTGGNPLLFGIERYDSATALPGPPGVAPPDNVPYTMPALTIPQAAGPGPVPLEGGNCTRIPVGGSLSIDLLSFEERGNFNPIVPGTMIAVSSTAFPVSLLFFGAVGGDTTADITYVNKLGTF